MDDRASDLLEALVKRLERKAEEVHPQHYMTRAREIYVVNAIDRLADKLVELATGELP